MQLRPNLEKIERRVKPPVETFFAIEDEFDIANVIHVSKDGASMSCIVNSIGDQKQFVYLYELEPIHQTKITPQTADAIVSGLREVGKLDKLTFQSQSFADDRERQSQLDRLAEGASPEIRFFLYNEKFRTAELTRKGIFKPKRLYAFSAYTVDPVTADADDVLEAVLARAMSTWHKHFTSKGEDLDRARTEELLWTAFEAWQDRTQLLATKMGFQVKSLGWWDIWVYLWEKFNRGKPAPALPHCLVLDSKGLREEYDLHPAAENPKKCRVKPVPGGELHLASRLVSGEKMQIPDREWVYLPGRKEYAGVIKLDKPPDGWADAIKQFSWLYDEVIAQDQVVNCEITEQFSWLNPKQNLGRLQRFAGQRRSKGAAALGRNKRDVGADVYAEQAEDAIERSIRGDEGIYVGLTIVVYAKTPQALTAALRYIQKRFHYPAEALREKDYAWRTWLQTLPLKWEGLCAAPEDNRLQLHASDAVGFTQLVGVCSRSKDGPLLLSEQGGSPIHISLEDHMGNPRHGAVFGRTGSGKSVKEIDRIIHALVRKMNVTIMDLTKEGSEYSTYAPFVEFMGGAQYDTGKNSNNLVELIDVRSMDPKSAENRLQAFYKNTIQMVLSLVLDNRRDSGRLPINEIESIVTMAVTAFYADPTIRRQCDAAREAGIGTAAWQDWPTLKHLYQFFDKERLHLSNFGDHVNRALDFIRLRLLYWLEGPFNRAIAMPSAFDGTSPLTLFSLSNTNSPEEAAIMALSAQTAAMRRAYSVPRSYFYADELSVLLPFPELAKSVGKYLATGRGVGLSAVLTTQDPNALANCVAADQICQNLSFKEIGKIATAAIPSFEKIFQYDPAMLALNAEDTFNPSRENIFSRWLVDDDGLITRCRYYPPYAFLGITANNRKEIKVREQFFEQYTDKYEATARFSQHLVQCMKQGRSL